MKKILIFVTLLLTLTSCKWFSSARLPELAFTNIKVPQGTPKFQKGYKDGCASVLYARGYGLYRSRYEYKFDPELIDDPEYFFGRKRGYNFCFGYITGPSGHFAKGWDGYLYAQGTAFNMGKGNIDDTIPQGNAFGTWGAIPEGGVGGFLGVLQQNRADKHGSVMGGHIFYGQTAKQQNQFLGW